MTSRVAVLDVDGTLLPGALGVRFLKNLMATGDCEPTAAAESLAAVERYHRGAVELNSAAPVVYRYFAAALAGTTDTAARSAALRAWEEAGRDVFPFARPLIRMLHAAGFRIALISGSPDEVVRLAAADLGVDMACGAVSEVVDGCYTGILVRTPGLPGGKRATLRDLTAGTGFDRPASFAIGNSSSDAEIFSCVGAAVAFEPDEVLRAQARAHGWATADRGDVLGICARLTAVRHR